MVCEVNKVSVSPARRECDKLESWKEIYWEITKYLQIGIFCIFGKWRLLILLLTE